MRPSRRPFAGHGTTGDARLYEAQLADRLAHAPRH